MSTCRLSYHRNKGVTTFYLLSKRGVILSRALDYNELKWFTEIDALCCLFEYHCGIWLKTNYPEEEHFGFQ